MEQQTEQRAEVARFCDNWKVPQEPTPIGRHHGLLTEFRRAFREGPPETPLAMEGPRLVGEALRSGVQLEKVLFSRRGLEQQGAKLLPQLSKHTEVAVAEDAVFAGAMDAEHPQGVAALAAWAAAKLEAVFGERALIVAAAGLQDPGNLGTLIRAADAFGASGVVALADTVSPFNAKAVRASAGSLFHLPVAARVTAEDLIAACRSRGVRLVATGARGGVAPAEAGLEGPVCLMIGQEAAGVPRALLRAADATVSIPIASRVESLNAAMAGAILLFEAGRVRGH
ncbi:MAG: RNA methyltransferase [Acidobacteria bacterium]|nr:MAG: RNA methyltransferase [Acidobacteriota bacterium]